MKKLFQTAVVAIFVYASHLSAAQADIYEVTVTNLTRGQIFSPIFAVTHDYGIQLFNAGTAASPELSALAQDADTSGLEALLSGSPSVNEIVGGSGVIPPGHSETLIIHSQGHKRFLSLASMLVTTNDAFIAVNKIRLPRLHQVIDVPAYDAGAEDNDESCAYIPGPPCGNPFSASAEEGEGYVHIHAGIHGIGDLSAAEYDWRNPVARITIRKIKRHHR